MCKLRAVASKEACGHIAGIMLQYCAGRTGQYQVSVIPHFGFAFMTGYQFLDEIASRLSGKNTGF
ncbi:hypothetical protein [Legionella spiritensis]|uniref:hypothetical protein n=1 Tax=Legionella spiritensis TaxID=452 RepID=UPI000F84C7C8|nr:hypothetical protein [Legionella spiritensis]